MTTDTKVNKFMERAFKKMFKAVEAPFSWEFCKKSNWYQRYVWTFEESATFKKWFVVEYMKTFKSPKRVAEKEWEMFFLNWGWKTTEE